MGHTGHCVYRMGICTCICMSTIVYNVPWKVGRSEILVIGMVGVELQGCKKAFSVH